MLSPYFVGHYFIVNYFALFQFAVISIRLRLKNNKYSFANQVRLNSTRKMSALKQTTADYSSQVYRSIGRKLYLSSELADIHFVFMTEDGESDRIPAHKMLLSAASAVFAKMFNGTWKEKDEVTIVDTPVAAFREFLQFFYLNDVNLTMENVDKVMNLGQMYDVTECLSVCNDFLKNHLNESNVCSTYELATLFDNVALMRSCETIIGMEPKMVFESEAFMTTDRKVLRKILSLNWLSCTEIDLFDAFVARILANSNQKTLTAKELRGEYLDLFDEIRFGAMPLQQFVTKTPEYRELFSYEEYTDIIQLIANGEYESKCFNSNRQTRDLIPWSEDDVIRCDRTISQFNLCKPYEIKSTEKTIFTINKPVLLKGIVCDGIYAYNYVEHKYFVPLASLQTQLTIVESPVDLDSDENKTLYTEKGALLNGNRVEILMPKPIIIRPGFMYEIRLDQKPSSDSCNGAILKREVCMEQGFIIRFHQDSVFPGDPNVSRGLVCALDFYKF